MPFSYLNNELHTLEDQGLLRRRRLVESAQGASIQVDGSAYLSFCSNVYLGLANHPALTAAAHAGATRYGVGSGIWQTWGSCLHWLAEMIRCLWIS